MKILLLGEYSNVHATLAEGLRTLGHEVTVLSNGDFWKDYPRDIDLSRTPSALGGIRYSLRLCTLLPKLKGFDVVQFINPMFLELKAKRILPVYRYLRRHNDRMVLGAFGMDYYWVHECMTRQPLRYSDFNIGSSLRNSPDALKERKDWLGTEKETLNRKIAADCDGIVAGLYEYWTCYHPCFPRKTTFIPMPIRVKAGISPHAHGGPLKVFIGISKGRSVYKGTDIMLAAARALQERYPEKMELRVAEGVPFDEYVQLMEGSDVLLDQLYAYSPSMNPLEAMSRGIICVGGGEEESYRILHEDELRPIINVQPSYESVYHELEQLVLHPERTVLLQRQSVEYIRRHHDHIHVARQYEAFYRHLAGRKGKTEKRIMLKNNGKP